MSESTLIRDEWCVVRNDEGRYSVWPTTRPLPAGWHAGEQRGSREECLRALESIWTDPRPLALRIAMEAAR